MLSFVGRVWGCAASQEVKRRGIMASWQLEKEIRAPLCDRASAPALCHLPQELV